jgi:hypothetical protein
MLGCFSRRPLVSPKTQIFRSETAADAEGGIMRADFNIPTMK